MPNSTHAPVLPLTAGQKGKYLSCGGINCPLCGSAEIEGTGDRNIEGTISTNEMHCLACGAAWTDVYQLHDVVLTGRGSHRRPAAPQKGME